MVCYLWRGTWGGVGITNDKFTSEGDGIGKQGKVMGDQALGSTREVGGEFPHQGGEISPQPAGNGAAGNRLVRTDEAHRADHHCAGGLPSFRDGNQNIARAFEKGADDYIMKHFSSTELVAESQGVPAQARGRMECASRTLCAEGPDHQLWKRLVTGGGRSVKLIPTE